MGLTQSIIVSAHPDEFLREQLPEGSQEELQKALWPSRDSGPVSSSSSCCSSSFLLLMQLLRGGQEVLRRDGSFAV